MRSRSGADTLLPAGLLLVLLAASGCSGRANEPSSDEIPIFRGSLDLAIGELDES